MSSRLFSLTCVQRDGRDPNKARQGELPAAGMGPHGKCARMQASSPGKKRARRQASSPGKKGGMGPHGKHVWKQASSPGKKRVADARYGGEGKKGESAPHMAYALSKHNTMLLHYRHTIRYIHLLIN